MRTLSHAGHVRRRLSLTHAILACLSLMGAGCAPLQAPPPFEPPPLRPILGEQVPLITLMLWHARDLSLTPEQIRGLETFRGDFQRTAERQAEELQRLEVEVQGLLGREQIDLTQAETRIRRIESLRTELRLGRIKTVEKGKATLTPEQWRKLQPLIRGGP